jgi:predicted ATP-grasp superfamily ATP-dependent carboligase
VGLTSSKLHTSQCLQRAGIAVVPTQRLTEAINFSMPWVMKPDDGVGCEDVYLVDDEQALNDRVQSLTVDHWVVQPWLIGQAASLCVIFSENDSQLLTYNKQLIEIKRGQVVFTGCHVGEHTEYWKQYRSLVQDIANCLPGLKGYVGIDVVETEDGPLVIEINPRLTTSYAGLRQALGVNPAQLILQSFDYTLESSILNNKTKIRPVTIDLKTV